MLFIGDMHGCFGQYREIIDSNTDSIQVGDMGIFTESDSHAIVTSQNHKFIRGNHDNPEMCRRHSNYLGEFGYIKNIELFWVSGASSIDAGGRLIGYDWWDDEELNYGQLESAVAQFADYKPRIVVTHTCPNSIKDLIVAGDKRKFVNRTEYALQVMLESHSPDIWIFGHYHQFFHIVNNGVQFIGLGDHRSERQFQTFDIPGLKF